MAIQVQNPTGSVLEVDPTFKAARASLRPMECLTWHSVGAPTGNIAGVAANAAIFSFRNISANPIAVRRVGFGCHTITAFTAAQITDFGLFFARAWSTSDSAGTAIGLTGSNCKHRTSLGALTSVDCRISTTAALTAGTRTVDANALGVVSQFSTEVFGIKVLPDNLFQHNPGDHPLILAQNEGIIIAPLTTLGAAGAIKAYVNMELAEVPEF